MSLQRMVSNPTYYICFETLQAYFTKIYILYSLFSPHKRFYKSLAFYYCCYTFTTTTTNSNNKNYYNIHGADVLFKGEATVRDNSTVTGVCEGRQCGVVDGDGEALS